MIGKMDLQDNHASQEYNVGVSGGSDNFSFYTSFGYLQDDGTIKGSGFDRLTGRTNVEYKGL